MLTPAFAGSNQNSLRLILGLAPQALCLRPHSRAQNQNLLRLDLITARRASAAGVKHRHETNHRAPSPRSGRQHKAWGARPRITKNQLSLQPVKRAAESEGERCRPRSRAQIKTDRALILGLAPQALCLRPPSRAKTEDKHEGSNRRVSTVSTTKTRLETATGRIKFALPCELCDSN